MRIALTKKIVISKGNIQVIKMFSCWLFGHKPKYTGSQKIQDGSMMDVVICQRCKNEGYSIGGNVFWLIKTIEIPDGICSSFDKGYCGLTGHTLKCENVYLCDERGKVRKCPKCESQNVQYIRSIDKLDYGKPNGDLFNCMECNHPFYIKDSGINKRISTKRLKNIIWGLMQNDFEAQKGIGDGQKEFERKCRIDGSIMGKGAVLEAVEIWEENPNSELLVKATWDENSKDEVKKCKECQSDEIVHIIGIHHYCKNCNRHLTISKDSVNSKGGD